MKRHTSGTLDNPLWLCEDSSSISLELLDQLPSLFRVLVCVDGRDIRFEWILEGGRQSLDISEI